MEDDAEDEGSAKHAERVYPWTNMKDLEFPYFAEFPPVVMEDGSKPPSCLNHFRLSTKYDLNAVVEDSIVDHKCLKQMKFFEPLHPLFVQELFQAEGCIRSVVCMPEENLATQGGLATHLIAVVKGRVQVSVDGVRRKVLRAGDVFGEREFLGAGPQKRTASAVALTFCDVRLLYHEALVKTLEKCPAVHCEFSVVQSAWTGRPEAQALRALGAFTESFARSLAPWADDELAPETAQRMRRSWLFLKSKHAANTLSSHTHGKPATPRPAEVAAATDRRMANLGRNIVNGGDAAKNHTDHGPSRNSL